MTAKAVRIADAIAAELNAATLSMPIEARVRYVLDETLEDAGAAGVKVDIAIATGASELSDRDALGYVDAFDLAIRKRLTSSDIDQETGEPIASRMSDLISLVEEINETLAASERLNSYDAAIWQDSEIRAFWVPAHVRQYNQFTGVLRVRYSVEESLA